MDGDALVPDDVLDPPPPPPPRLYERLRQIAGYTWHESRAPFHSSYDFWHVFGTRHVSPTSPPHSSHHADATSTKFASGRPALPEHGYPPSSDSLATVDSLRTSLSHVASTPTNATTETSLIDGPVVARVSYHAVREERAFQIAKNLIATADPHGDHIVEPLDLIRLSPAAGDDGTIIVAIYTDPGLNYLRQVYDMGPAFYTAHRQGDVYVSQKSNPPSLEPPIKLEYFLDFAIGAAQCLEILHHSQGMIHGEIRGDAFHFNIEENKVRIMSFGSGIRSFEHGLTSTGWSSLSKEVGAKNKLLYISPEQTGRMPAEPDTRTDIYSLGVVLWTMLTQQPVYVGDTPLDIVQGVLGRRIPNVSTVRMDIPDAVGRIVQKCTAKNVAERYHSASGLRHDLMRVQQLLADGDSCALKELTIGSKDVSSFFLLPTSMIGRHEEREKLIKVINRVSKTHSMHVKVLAANVYSDTSSLANETIGDDFSSEGASSVDGTNGRSGSFTQTASWDVKQAKATFYPPMFSDSQTLSSETMSSSFSGPFTRPVRPWERHLSMSADTVSLTDSMGLDGARASDSIGSSLSRQLGAAKFRRRGQCEIVTIEGAGGLGKSFLVQSVLPEARRRGYCATAKFDTTRRTAFGPLLKLLSSLFKQVWGERNTETSFHQGLKAYVGPVWPMLHRALGLPEFLLGPREVGFARSLSSNTPLSGSRGGGRPLASRRGSSPGCSPGPFNQNSSVLVQSPQEYLCAGAATKTTRLMDTCLDILRVFTAHKFICFCLDDVHFADDESLELINQIICAKMKMVIIMTYRPEELSRDRMDRIIHPPEPDEFSLTTRRVVTRITLSALTEDDIVEYVSALLSRPKQEILSLALVIQSKTAGNPFYMREMLSACHRKKCIWYDYRDSQWHYNLDKLFAQFQGERDYDVLDTGFITQRLNELPPAARAVLAWGALLGSSFSFELVSRLMQGEVECDWGEASCRAEAAGQTYSGGEAIAGLQAAIQAYILVPSDSDDRFRFAHDRYVQASADLKECNARRMHFVIAQTLLKDYGHDERQRASAALHICEALSMIKQRVGMRREYRQLLMECGQAAMENGARPTATKYYTAAIELLQEDGWEEEGEDASYEETMQLYLCSAECYLFMSQLSAANEALSRIFSKARTALDKAPAYVLQSRIFAQKGNSLAAFISLKECLSVLDVELDEEPTYEKCDEWFERLALRIRTTEREQVVKAKQSPDKLVGSIGAVLSETASAAWWNDCLHFYHLTLVMVDMHFGQGAFPQSGMAFLNLAVVALSRFNMVEFCIELGSMCQELLVETRDTFSMARGQMLHACCIGHVQYSMKMVVAQSEDAVELATMGGDRMSTIMSFGLCAMAKFFASDNCAEVEAFCHYGCEQIPNWALDTRGGSLLIAIRQLCRALQGKTQTGHDEGVLSDEQHEAGAYKRWLLGQTDESERPTLFYESFELVALRRCCCGRRATMG
ncbi:hypothetical protein CDD81_1161 [Ophiocordyceps australis]|uniref:Protein kinase domain-containing protein n=1 Tax=Ophiocordyceps australis TaxID=1399860 RepID=A0A2C5Y0A9_9HYPO|nr:hypothetical protein CDD81_1161 [Ophiocordyceps australis]